MVQPDPISRRNAVRELEGRVPEKIRLSTWFGDRSTLLGYFVQQELGRHHAVSLASPREIDSLIE